MLNKAPLTVTVLTVTVFLHFLLRFVVHLISYNQTISTLLKSLTFLELHLGPDVAYAFSHDVIISTSFGILPLSQYGTPPIDERESLLTYN